MRLIWSVTPPQKIVEVYRLGQFEPVQRLNLGQVLSGGDVIPGFEMSLDEIFG